MSFSIFYFIYLFIHSLLLLVLRFFRSLFWAHWAHLYHRVNSSSPPPEICGYGIFMCFWVCSLWQKKCDSVINGIGWPMVWLLACSIQRKKGEKKNHTHKHTTNKEIVLMIMYDNGDPKHSLNGINIYIYIFDGLEFGQWTHKNMKFSWRNS